MLKITSLITKNGNLVNGPLVISPNIFEDDRGFFMRVGMLKLLKKILKKKISVSFKTIIQNLQLVFLEVSIINYLLLHKVN